MYNIRILLMFEIRFEMFEMEVSFECKSGYLKRFSARPKAPLLFEFVFRKDP